MACAPVARRRRGCAPCAGSCRWARCRRCTARRRQPRLAWRRRRSTRPRCGCPGGAPWRDAAGDLAAVGNQDLLEHADLSRIRIGVGRKPDARPQASARGTCTSNDRRRSRPPAPQRTAPRPARPDASTTATAGRHQGHRLETATSRCWRKAPARCWGRARGGLGSMAGGGQRAAHQRGTTPIRLVGAEHAAASAAPAGMRISGISPTAYRRQGIQSAKNSTNSVEAARAQHRQCCSSFRPAAARPSRKPDAGEQRRVRGGRAAESRWPSRGGGVQAREPAGVGACMPFLASQFGARLPRKKAARLPAFVAGADVGDAARGVGAQPRHRWVGDRPRPAPASLAGAHRHRPHGHQRGDDGTAASSAGRRRNQLVHETHRGAPPRWKRSAVTNQRRAACFGAHHAWGPMVAGSRPSFARSGRSGALGGANSTSHTAARPRPPAIIVAVHAPDHGQRARVGDHSISASAMRVGAVLPQPVAGHGAHPVQVGAGTEGLAVPAEHDGAQRAVGASPVKVCVSSVITLLVEGVAHRAGRLMNTRDATGPLRCSRVAWSCSPQCLAVDLGPIRQAWRITSVAPPPMARVRASRRSRSIGVPRMPMPPWNCWRCTTSLTSSPVSDEHRHPAPRHLAGTRARRSGRDGARRWSWRPAFARRWRRLLVEQRGAEPPAVAHQRPA